MSAYSCRPHWGSEPGVGWRFATEIAKRHQVWVLVDRSNEPFIARHQAASENPRFLYHQVPLWPTCPEKSNLGMQLHYYLWQRTMAPVARRLHGEIGFDVVHHTNWARCWMPSGLAGVDAPFVWGPVGAAESIPAGFVNGLNLRARFSDRLRNAARRVALLDPALGRTARRASVALVTTGETGEKVASLGVRRTEQMGTVGFTEEELHSFRNLPAPDTSMFRAICIGRLLHWKGFHLAIQAFALFHAKCPRSELWIVNDGPEEGWLKELARSEGAADAVRFWGKLPSIADVYAKLASCRVLIHPALHEAFGIVCTEAMASGRPVICLDVGGPATQVTSNSGFRVSTRSQEAAIQGIADALEQLYKDPTLCARLGEGARERVSTEFSSDSLTSRLDALYEDVVRNGSYPNGKNRRALDENPDHS
jgi:glycosyltransferase involved in cell wall biosynthesis